MGCEKSYYVDEKRVICLNRTLFEYDNLFKSLIIPSLDLNIILTNIHFICCFVLCNMMNKKYLMSIKWPLFSMNVHLDNLMV